MSTKVAFECAYDGQSIKKNKVVTLGFRSSLSELSETMRLVFVIGKVFKVGVSVGDERIPIGECILAGYSYDRDGEQKIKLETDVDAMKCTTEDIKKMLNKSIRLIIKEGNGDAKEGNGDV